jgi:hypothetical protein
LKIKNYRISFCQFYVIKEKIILGQVKEYDNFLVSQIDRKESSGLIENKEIIELVSVNFMLSKKK